MSNILRNLSRSAPRLGRPLTQRTQVLGPRLTRTYAQKDGASPGQTSNVSNPQASSAESQGINQRAAAGRTDKNDADHASIQNPVSHPEESGLGAQEEATESQEHMKHDPNKPDSQKRKETLEYGQNKKLDPADK